jgi:hypothetical protein
MSCKQSQLRTIELHDLNMAYVVYHTWDIYRTTTLTSTLTLYFIQYIALEALYAYMLRLKA